MTINPAVLSPERQTVITATDSTILMGTVPEMWGTAESIWLDKMGVGIKKKPNLSMFLGHVFEPHIVNAYEQIAKTCQVMRSPGFFKMDDAPFGCTPDAWVENALGTVAHGFEAKSTTSDREWGRSGTTVPDRVMVQVQHSMMCKDVVRWDVGMFLYDKDRKEEIAVKVMEQGDLTQADIDEFVLDQRWYSIERNDEIIRQIKSVGFGFWDNYVVRRVRPTDLTQRVELPALAQPIESRDDSMLPLVLAVANAKTEAKAATDTAERLTLELRKIMAHSESGILNVGPYKVTHLPINRKPAPDYALSFDAACNLGNLSDTDRAFLLSNYMKKDIATTYRLDIKESK